jgi:hypothetical protein
MMAMYHSHGTGSNVPADVSAIMASMLPRRIFGFVLFSLFCLPIQADDAADQKPFLGTWQAKFQGRVYFTIRLAGGEEIGGTVSTGKISFDDDGDLTEAEPSPTGKVSPIRNPVIENGKLTFEVEDDGEPLKMEMKLVGENQADLLLFIPETKVKPIRFRRSS